MLFSVLKTRKTAYTRRVDSFADLADAVRNLPDGVAGFSNIVWKRGRRRVANFRQANFLILDVDQGPSVQEVVSTLEKERMAYIIQTTKSHRVQKGKDGARDRYRIFLALTRPILHLAEFRATMNKLLIKYPFIDPACLDGARFFEPGGQMCSGLGLGVVPETPGADELRVEERRAFIRAHGHSPETFSGENAGPPMRRVRLRDQTFDCRDQNSSSGDGWFRIRRRPRAAIVASDRVEWFPGGRPRFSVRLVPSATGSGLTRRVRGEMICMQPRECGFMVLRDRTSERSGDPPSKLAGIPSVIWGREARLVFYKLSVLPGESLASAWMRLAAAICTKALGAGRELTVDHWSAPLPVVPARIYQLTNSPAGPVTSEDLPSASPQKAPRITSEPFSGPAGALPPPEELKAVEAALEAWEPFLSLPPGARRRLGPWIAVLVTSHPAIRGRILAPGVAGPGQQVRISMSRLAASRAAQMPSSPGSRYAASRALKKMAEIGLVSFAEGYQIGKSACAYHVSPEFCGIVGRYLAAARPRPPSPRGSAGDPAPVDGHWNSFIWRLTNRFRGEREFMAYVDAHYGDFMAQKPGRRAQALAAWRNHRPWSR